MSPTLVNNRSSVLLPLVGLWTSWWSALSCWISAINLASLDLATADSVESNQKMSGRLKSPVRMIEEESRMLNKDDFSSQRGYKPELGGR